MRRALLLPLSAALLALGCGDDPVAPGSLVVRWTHGPTPTCDSRHVVELEARAYLRNVLEGSATTPCPASDGSGSMLIEDLPPGTYKVVVEAYDTEGKGLYLGTAEKQAVREGKSTDSAVIRLDQKPVRLNVTWNTPTGRCAGSPIRRVRVEVVPKAGTVGDVVAEAEGACEAEVKDPDDPSEMLAGVLFTGLDPDSDVKVFAHGLDDKGHEIAVGVIGPFILSPGDDVEKNILLALCPGEPPVCE